MARPPAPTAQPFARTVFSTDSVPVSQRYEAWRALFGVSHEIRADPDGFSAHLQTTQVGPMMMHVMHATPQQVSRSAATVRRDGLDHFVLHLSRHALDIQTPGGDLRVPAGGVSVNDLARTYVRQAAPETGSLILALPRALVVDAHGTTNGLHGQIFRPQAGGLFIDHMRALRRRLDQLPADAGPDLAQATARLMAACLAPTRERLALAREALDEAALERAKRIIDAELASTELGPDRVAASLGVSRRTLFRIFAPLGGVSHVIWERRLLAVSWHLANPSDLRSVAQIGQSLGFKSEAHLSRAFRKRFDVNPRDYRMSSTQGLPPANRAAAHISEMIRNLG